MRRRQPTNSRQSPTKPMLMVRAPRSMELIPSQVGAPTRYIARLEGSCKLVRCEKGVIEMFRSKEGNPPDEGDEENQVYGIVAPSDIKPLEETCMSLCCEVARWQITSSTPAPFRRELGRFEASRKARAFREARIGKRR